MAKRASDASLFKRIALEARPCWPHLAGMLALGLVSVPLALLGPLPLKLAVDHVIGTRPLTGGLGAFVAALHVDAPSGLLLLAAILVVLIALARQAVKLVEEWLRSYVRETLTVAMRARVFRHAQRLSTAHHDRQGVADAAYRIQTDVPEAQSMTVDLAPSIVSGATLLGMFVIAARIDWTLAFAGAAMAPGLLVVNALYRRRFRTNWHEVKGHETAAQSVVHEALGAIRVVRAFNREEREEERFAGRLDESMASKLQMTWSEGVYGLHVSALTALGAALVLWLGVRHVQQGVLTLGQLLIVLAYMSQFYEPLKQLSRRAVKMQSRLASADRVFALLDRSPDMVEKPNARPLRRFQDVIRVHDVSFGYRGEPVLRDVNLEIPRGARVGISGPTGSGKTTLANLLARFLDPTTGRIELDGVDLRDYRLADLRSQFAVVLQEPVLFSTTIAENIAYARPGADRRAIEDAARAACAHDFIRALPEGYETKLGERGLDLSGGERQRVSLARAFLKDAPILLLDEPTSAIDPATEAQILEATARLMQGRTTVLIAHRTSLFEHCDLRLSIANGRVEPWRPERPSAAAGA
jgi:ATP-binding cassette, subfamily B, bacterial